MRNEVIKTALIIAVLLVAVWPAAAQIEVGDNTTLSMSGILSAGYSGSFSDTDISSHGLDLGGIGHINGSYYNPRFLSFQVEPYYRRSQSNSVYQSITDSSGVNASVNLFSGSHFPGSVAYSKTYDTTGQFGVPGLSGVTSNGDGRNFAITWSALLPDKPTFTASYSKSGGTSTVFGANAESESSSRNLTLQSTYKLLGFQLQGQFTNLAMDADFPAILDGGEKQTSRTGSNTFLFNAGHPLPTGGYWSLTWNRSDYDGSYRIGENGGSNNGVINEIDTTFSLNPTRKLSTAFLAEYNDNAYGTIQKQLLEEGGITPLQNSSGSSRIYSVGAQVGYTVFSHLSLYGRTIHRELDLPTGDRGLTQFSGNAAFNFAHRLLGALTFSVGVIDTATEEGNSGASLVGNVNILRHLNKWEVEGNFGYTQQVETLVSVYATSFLSYGTKAKRRFSNGLTWYAGFNGSHSGMTQYDGFGSRHESFTSGIHFNRFSINGQYSQSSGSSILTPGGLVEVPPGLPLVQQPILYNGKSYGGGGSFTPVRRLTLSGTYNKATSGTAGPLTSSRFDSTILNARMQYRLRKLDFDANLTRFQQSISTGLLPATINTYWIRVSRWFNVF